MTKATGTCPCCFRMIALDGQLMHRHGYRQPGRGTGYAPICGGCISVSRFRPLDESSEGTIYILRIVDEDEKNTRAWLDALCGGKPGLTIDVETIERQVHVAGRFVVPKRVFGRYTRETWDAYKREHSQYSSWDWDRSIVANARTRAEARFAGIQAMRQIAGQKLREFGWTAEAVQAEGVDEAADI